MKICFYPKRGAAKTSYDFVKEPRRFKNKVEFFSTKQKSVKGWCCSPELNYTLIQLHIANLCNWYFTFERIQKPKQRKTWGSPVVINHLTYRGRKEWTSWIQSSKKNVWRKKFDFSVILSGKLIVGFFVMYIINIGYLHGKNNKVIYC